MTSVSVSACTTKEVLTDDLGLSKRVVRLACGVSHHLFHKFMGRAELNSCGVHGASLTVRASEACRSLYDVESDDLLWILATAF
jgi:hypothetical protein